MMQSTPLEAILPSMTGESSLKLLKLLALERPSILDRGDEQLVLRLQEAERHFLSRKLHHARVFDEHTPPTADESQALKRIIRREEYIRQEIQREMNVWVRNYPLVDRVA